MKVLLLGGTGTLSFEVLRQSLQRGYALSILNRGNNNCIIDKNVCTYIADLKQSDKVLSALDGNTFDVIVDFFSRTKEDIANLFPLFSKRCEQYIFISSACVYCRSNISLDSISENTPKPNTLWSYNINKYEAEQMLVLLSRLYKRCYTIVRPYITYDDWRIPFGIAPAYRYHRTLIERIRNKKPMFLWDEGRNYCTLTYSSDFAEALVGLFLNPKAMNEDFHITSDYCYTWKDVLLALYNQLDMSPNIISIPVSEIIQSLPEYREELVGDRNLNAIFDNKKIKDAVPSLSFKTSLEDGLKKIIDHYDGNNDFEYDYRYDARLDRMLAKVGEKGLHYIPYPNCRSDSKEIYTIYRSFPLNFATRLNNLMTRFYR